MNKIGIFSGGGVCLNCTDFTTGINCEKCIAGYYRTYVSNVMSSCLPCECNADGSIGECNPVDGVCTCREGFTGTKCDKCNVGHGGANCRKCPCDVRGTMPGGECESHCQCKVGKYKK